MSEPVTEAYDVVLSYRRPDNGHFCEMLRHALREAGVHAFVNTDDLSPGGPAWTTMQSVLKSARFTLPVFTEGYATSPLCLEEVAAMMQCPDKVVPVFMEDGAILDTLMAKLSRCASC